MRFGSEYVQSPANLQGSLSRIGRYVQWVATHRSSSPTLGSSRKMSVVLGFSGSPTG